MCWDFLRLGSRDPRVNRAVPSCYGHGSEDGLSKQQPDLGGKLLFFYLIEKRPTEHPVSICCRGSRRRRPRLAFSHSYATALGPWVPVTLRTEGPDATCSWHLGFSDGDNLIFFRVDLVWMEAVNCYCRKLTFLLCMCRAVRAGLGL